VVVDRDGAEPVWFTVAEAAQILRVDRSTVYELVATGALVHKRFGRRTIRIPYSAVYPATTDTPSI
jgi:excisionase family DNA binding protein